MRKWLGAATTAICIALLAPGSASAITEVGNNCAATGALSLVATVAQLKEAAGNPLSLTVQETGVVTGWRVNTATGPSGVSEKLKVLRGNLEADPQVIGESAVEPITASHIFKTRIPVLAGDHLGVFGPAGFFICLGGGSDGIAGYTGDVPVGSNASLEGGVTSVKLAVSAFVEPDADGDGYGDESQDRCLNNAAVHDECPLSAPILAVDADAFARKSSLLVLVSVSNEATVKTTGRVSWAFKPKPKGRQSKAKVVVGFGSGNQSVKPGQIGRFTIRLPGAVKRQLARTPRRKSLKARLSISAADPTGQVGTADVVVRLKGRARG